MKLVYIHGAGATKESFNYIRDNIGGDDLALSYVSQDGFEHNLKAMSAQVEKLENVFFIAHSLGGIYALNLAAKFPGRILGAVTISTPYGGSEIAEVAKFFAPFHKLLSEIGPTSLPIVKTKMLKVQHPWTNIITTVGNSPWIPGANDGVVTLSSMQARTDIKTKKVKLNHYEILVSPQTVEIIKACIQKIK
jgi:pimeloyl-ACP methyl ester carboxylesterase